MINKERYEDLELCIFLWRFHQSIHNIDLLRCILSQNQCLANPRAFLGINSPINIK